MSNLKEYNDITVGDKFLCIKQCYFDVSKVKIFEEGKIYVSEIPRCITDCKENKWHRFTENFWKQYLIKISPLELLGDKIMARRYLSKYNYIYEKETNQYIQRNNKIETIHQK